MDLTQFIAKENEYSFIAKSNYMTTINNWLKNFRREALRGTAPEPFVLIVGEIGVGKEGLARMIHQGSRRCKNPWLVLNCALTADEALLEKELFGESTFAFNQKCIINGIFDLAKGGTVYLEKIDLLPPLLQNKLLQVIKSGKYRRIGGEEDLVFDVRLISESDQNLKTNDSHHLTQKPFSEDLRNLLSVVTLEIPPLRNRPEDILPMARYFAKINFKHEGKQFQGFTAETEKSLTSYPWPGNTHELIYLIKRSALLSGNESTATLEPLGIAPVELDTVRGGPGEPSSFPPSREEHSLDKTDKTGSYALLKRQWCDSFEQNYLTHILRRHKGNVSSAAREAKLDRSNFLRLMRRHGIKSDDYRSNTSETRHSTLLKVA